MQLPLDLTFRGMAASPSLRAAIERWVARLEHLHGRIQHCAVIIEQQHQHHRRGNAISAHVIVTVPGHEIAVSRDAGDADAYVAVADAFRAARRQLSDFLCARRELATTGV